MVVIVVVGVAAEQLYFANNKNLSGIVVVVAVCVTNPGHGSIPVPPHGLPGHIEVVVVVE